MKSKQRMVALNAKKQVFRLLEPDRLVRVTDRTSVEQAIQNLSRIGYYFRPFVAVAAATGGKIHETWKIHPNSFYPLSPLDYGTAINKYVRGELVVPVQIFTTLSDRCNFACTMCFNRKEREAGKPTDLSADTYISTLKYILSFGGPLAQNISSGGSGEAILHPEFSRILEFSGDQGILTFLTTNGSRLKGQLADCIARNTSIVTFSIHGIHEGAFRKLENAPRTVTLEKIIRNIEEVIKQREKADRSGELVIGVTSLVHPENTGHYIEFVKKMVELGVDYVHFNPILPSPRTHNIVFTVEERERTEEELDQMPVLFSGAKTFIRVPYEIDPEESLYFNPQKRRNPDTCLISLFQPSIHPIYGDKSRAKVACCRFYPVITNDPEYWYTDELGPRTFESIWTTYNVSRIQEQTRKCTACSSERQLMTLDWMLDIKRRISGAEFYLLFPV